MAESVQQGGLTKSSIVCSVFAVLAAVVVGIWLVTPIGDGPEEALAALKMALDQRFPALESDRLVREVEQAIGRTGDAIKRATERPVQTQRPGLVLSKTKKAKHPVIILPGITSMALELWRGRPCASESAFREKFWGSTQMAYHAVRNQMCWLDHLTMSPKHWGDPDGIVVRPVEGIASSDYLFPGYYVWGKVVQNLADVGYHTGNIYVAAYDWRLAPDMCESRDLFFSKLKSEIELNVRRNGEKVVLVSHSMGSIWAVYFLHWASANAGHKWIESHLDGWVNIAGALLGVPKALGAILTGDVRDSVEFGQFGRDLIGKLLGSRKIPAMMRSMGSLASLLPLGPSQIWDVATGGPSKMATFRSYNAANVRASADTKQHDDVLDEKTIPREVLKEITANNYSKAESIRLLRTIAPRYTALVDEHYAVDESVKRNPKDNRQWANPSLLPLPKGTGKLRIYCLYGVMDENSTEVGYHYQVDSRELDTALPIAISHTTAGDLKDGIRTSFGDGSVPLVSLGYMCAKWQTGEHNPYKARVVIREKSPHTDASGSFLTDNPVDVLRGGGRSASHVEILGNDEILADVLRVVAGDDLPNDVFTDIMELSQKVPLR